MKTKMGNVMLGMALCLMTMVSFASADITWVRINDPGVAGHEGFNGRMSKYETTNAQYCEFLNTAKATGDISVSGDCIYGANGSNSGEDFVGQLYYDLAGPGGSAGWPPSVPGGGAARINFTGGLFSVDSGFEDHPVTYVSWYGATAFCNYYGYRLPTEWEWEAVADYDGSFLYGCGTTINNSIANYWPSIHPDGSTIVGAFGTYGYGMCDMAGNVWEWTSSIFEEDSRGLRGGAWDTLLGSDCSVSLRHNGLEGFASYGMGFRVCRSELLVCVDIDPDTLSLSSKDKWVTCYIELPSGYEVMDIDGASVKLEGISAYIGAEGWARAGANSGNIMDHDGDGILERMVKFDGAAIRAYLSDLGASGYSGLTVNGDLVGGPSFEGIDVIKVIK